MKKILTINMLVASTGLLVLGGCASTSPDYESASYMEESSGAERTATAEQKPSAATAATAGAAQDNWVIPLHQEQLSVGKQTVDAGQVTIRKTVTTENVSQPVQLRKETVTIERQPAGAASTASSTSATGAPFEEKTYTIQLKEEQPVIQKNTVVTGEVVAKKNAAMQQQNVSQQLRRENIQLDKGADSADVTVHGNFDNVNEAAGAQKDQKAPKDIDKDQNHQQQQEP